MIEIIVSLAIIVLFSMILLADYPKIKRQFALSRSAYKLAQDIRRAQDLGLSGVRILDKNGLEVLAEGYGIYISADDAKNKQYILYADRGDRQYDGNLQFCEQQTDSESDCIVEIIDMNEAEREVHIERIIRIDGDETSINFNPPNPDIAIENISSMENSIGIVLALDSDPLTTRTVYINTSGLIEVE